MNTLLLKQHLASSLSDLASALETNPKSEKTDEVVLDVLKTGTQYDADILRCIGSVNEELSAITATDGFTCELSLHSLYGEAEEDSHLRCMVLDGLSSIVCKAQTADSHKQNALMRFVYQTLKGLDGVTDRAAAAKTMEEMNIVSSVLC